MDYKNVKTGDDLTIPADVWNALQANLQEQKGGGPGKRTPVKPAKQINTGAVLIWNQTGAVVPRYHALAIEAPVVAPAVHEDEFTKRITLRGIIPTGAHAGLWCVVQDALPVAGWGTAVVAGITIARINLASTAHKTVERNAASTLLLSTNAGSGQIVWVAGGVGTATSAGEQYAIIRLPMGGGSLSAGEFQWQNYLMVSANQPGWDDDRTTAVLEDG